MATALLLAATPLPVTRERPSHHQPLSRRPLDMILSFPQAIRATQKSTGSFSTTAGVANSAAPKVQ